VSIACLCQKETDWNKPAVASQIKLMIDCLRGTNSLAVFGWPRQSDDDIVAFLYWSVR